MPSRNLSARLRFSFTLATGATVLAATLLPAIAQDAIGVPSCDSFLKTYQSCIVEKAGPDQKAKVAGDLDKIRANWKAVSATPEGKAELDATCKKTTETLKAQAGALNCAW